MGNNLDRIVNVSIEIASPIVDSTSFDNLLIIGPLPMVAPAKAPPKFGVYRSVDEVADAGWVTSGKNADPVGVAARVAFSQSPPPSTIYIAPQQLTPAAVTAGKTIEAVGASIGEYLGKKENLTGCTLVYDEDSRTLNMRLTGSVAKVKNTGVFETMSDIIRSGYSITINDSPVANADDFRLTAAFEQLAALKKKGDAAEFVVMIRGGKDDPAVPYGVSVQYVGATAAEEDAEPVGRSGMILANPQNEIEEAVVTAQRAMDNSGWYILCTAGVDSSEYEDIAEYIEANKKMFAYTELGFFGVGKEGENKPAVGNVYYRTFGIYGRETTDQADEDIPEANRYINVAWAARCLYYHAGKETWVHKSLSGIYPSALSSTEISQLEAGHISFFITTASKNITYGGQVMAGEWIDLIRFRDWLENDMQVRVANLFITNPKIPYTDNGIALVQNQMIASLKSGVYWGGIAPDEYNEDGNLIPSFTTHVPLSVSLTASQKASRKLTDCTFTARIAGAIHFVEIKGTLAYEL